MAAVAARRGTTGVRIHLAAHGRELLFHPFGPVTRIVYSNIRRRVLNAVDMIHPVSRYTAGLVEKEGVPRDRIHTVSNGTDPATFRPTDGRAVRRSMHAGSRPVLLTLCRLVRRKGVDIVIRAMPDILTDHPETLLLVAGEGPERRVLERLAHHEGVADSVRFLGAVPYAALPEYLSAADVFVLTPRHVPPDVEGFGLVYLEAGACERPVIGTRTGGIGDAVRDGVTGLLVPPENARAVAGAVHLLLSDPSVAREFGRAGRSHALDHANWERVVSTLVGCFEKGQRTADCD
jgi:phosphatidylinositol alpha-1,6-mannosyltransferase